MGANDEKDYSDIFYLCVVFIVRKDWVEHPIEQATFGLTETGFDKKVDTRKDNERW